MFTNPRRAMCPAIAFLSLLFFCLVALPALGQQSYVPSPSYISASISLNSPGSGTNTSSATGGLPSVNAGGTATVTFYFQVTYSAHNGGGAASVEYKSDAQSTWSPIESLTSQASGSYSRTVNVQNLSTLHFEMLVNASVGQDGYANITGNASNLSVSIGSSPTCTCTSSHLTCADTNGSIQLTSDLANASVFYTVDGSAATEASVESTDPVPVASGTTINAVVVQMANGGNPGQAIQNAQLAVNSWKTVLASTSAQSSPYAGDYDTPSIDYCSTQYCDQGVQGIPTAIDFLSSGSLSFPSASPQGSSTIGNLAFATQNIQGLTYPSTPTKQVTNETQVLWPYNLGGTDCHLCTSLVEDFYIWPQYTKYIDDSSNLEESEMDLELWDRSDPSLGEWLTAGLQCSVRDGGWDYSGQGSGGWHLLKDANGNPLNHDCPLPSGTLSATITASASSFTVSPNAANSTVEPGMIVLIDNEEIFCKAVSGNECTNAVRGYGGTMAAGHVSGARWAGSVHVQYHATRNPGYTGNCTNDGAPVECIYIDYLNLNYYPGLGGAISDNHNTFSGLSVPAKAFTSSSGYSSRTFNQMQMNIAAGKGSQSNPVTVGEYIDEDNVTASWGVLASGSCTVP